MQYKRGSFYTVKTDGFEGSGSKLLREWFEVASKIVRSCFENGSKPINFLLNSFLKSLILEPWPPNPDFPDSGRRPEPINFPLNSS